MLWPTMTVCTLWHDETGPTGWTGRSGTSRALHMAASDLRDTQESPE